MKKIFHIFGSLRLTVILLAVSTLLVLLGTLDQANWGIYHTQERYFHSWVVFSPVVSLLSLVVLKTYPENLEFLVLPLPGGFLLGALLSINLVCAHFRYYRPGWRRSGIILIHGGLILLIVSGFLGSALQREWQMSLDEGGGPVRHLTAIRGSELALVRVGEDEDTHHVVPGAALERGETIRFPGTGVTVRIEDLVVNSLIEGRARLIRMESAAAGDADSDSGEASERAAALLGEDAILLVPLPGDEPGDEPVRIPPEQWRGLAADGVAAVEQKPTYRHNESNIASAVASVEADGEPLGTWLLSTALDLIPAIAPQTFAHDGNTYRFELRFPREYLPFSLALEDFTHRRHPNTNIPAEFASQVVLDNPRTGEKRDIRISMNNPLRYAGHTFYQASFANDDQTSVLQVVRNPSRILPYVSITVVGLGLILHFILRLVRFTNARHPGQTDEPAATRGKAARSQANS